MGCFNNPGHTVAAAKAWLKVFEDLMSGLASNGDDTSRGTEPAWQKFDAFIGGADYSAHLDALKASANVKSYFATALVDKKAKSDCTGFVMDSIYGTITGAAGDRDYNGKALERNKGQSSLSEVIADKMRSISSSLEDNEENNKKSKRVAIFAKKL
jgi:hypothetical protein